MPADDIARLYDFEPNTPALSGEVDAELNQLISACNGKAGRSVANTFSAHQTLTSATMSSTLTLTHATTPLAVNKVSEYTGGNGVDVDSVLCKDGTIRVPGSAGYTPASNGDFGYDSTAHAYKGYVNGAVRTFIEDNSILNYVSFNGYIGGKLPYYNDAASIIIPAGFTFSNSSGVVFKAASNITLTLASSGASGLDTGSEAGDTHYYAYMIRKSSDGAVSAVWSTVNETVSGSITLPSGYDQKAQLPLSVRNNSSSNIIAFVLEWMAGKRSKQFYNVALSDPPGSGGGALTTAGATSILNNGTATVDTALSGTASFASGIAKAVDLMVWSYENNHAFVFEASTTNYRPCAVVASSGSAGGVVYVNSVPVSSSKQVGYKLTSGTSISIDVYGVLSEVA